MLVLFLLMGAAFVVVSNDFYRAAKKRSTRHQKDIDQTAQIERAFYELLRGPELTNSNSPLRGHSLLADMYGYGIAATVRTASSNSSEHFITLTLNNDAQNLIDQSSFQLDPVPGSLSGQVLSVVTGRAKGLATRIVDHQVTGTSSSGYTHTFTVLPYLTDSGFRISNAGLIQGHRVVINGRPFSGTGAGHYNPFTSRGSEALSTTALEPNQKGRSLGELLGTTDNGYFSFLNSSFQTRPNSQGPNECYDTFDFQNMFLAGINPDGTIEVPSFYRSALTRPRGEFRAFQQGGPDDDGIAVDNNNDGTADGIWMDIGLPNRSRPDGIVVKPLVSYLVVDMDGRINLNAHGNLVRDGDISMSEIGFLAHAGENLKRGQGYGPPEISMTQVMGIAANNILSGSAQYPGRYGADGKPGEANVRDGWSHYKLFGYPDDEFGEEIPGTVDRHFGSAMDVFGRFAVGYPTIFDITDNTFPIGMPVANVGFSNLSNEIVDSPYEMTFADRTLFGPMERGFDTPFTPQELEGVFRRCDPDSRFLSRRLWDLGYSALSSGAQHSVTTDSFEVPTTYENLPEKLYRILANGSGSTGIPTTAPNRDTLIRNQIRLMLPPEVFRGLPMNVNRPFGDGIDNNDNGVIDEIGEEDVINHPNGTQYSFDHDNDSSSSGDMDSYLAKSSFARHLYIVTLLSTERIDRNGDGMISVGDWYDFNNDGTTNQDDLIDFRRVIAQWAVNVIDFRDRDVTMTAFEFDLNPWNGWDVDGDLTTTEDVQEGTPPSNMRQVLWGAERPELLISETMVTHDRRTQDLEIELMPPGETAETTADGDGDFDSHLVPKVSAFFELYNPWVMNDANQIRPSELYDENLSGVDLQKTSPDGSSPVWRMIVTNLGDEDLDPDDPSQNDSDAMPTVLRRIYFIRPSIRVDTGPEVFFPDEDIEAGTVGPGRYAVVGTAGQKVGDRYDTYFGRRLTPEALEPDELENQTRRISLNPVDRQLQIVQWNPDNSDFDTFTRSVVNIPIGLNDGGWERELGVSDPVDGYFSLTGVGGIPIGLETIVDGAKFTEEFTTPGVPTDFAFDEPVDRMIDQDHYRDFLQNDGLQPAYRTLHLQRLANPMLPFDPDTNPYRTIDSSSLDLFVFNGAETIEDPNNQPGIMRFGTYERRGDSDSNFGQADGRHRLLFKNDRLGRQNAGDENHDENFFNDLDNHIFSWNFLESFGGLNDAFKEADADDPKPFCWLTWNNRPFASQLELANVPFTSSYWTTRLFDIAADDTRNVYSPPKDEFPDNEAVEARNYTAHFPHLLNFYADRVESETFGPSLHRVFDYLEVPSRFVGTESYVNPATFANNAHGLSTGFATPFDTISNYRYPGKININTILDPKVWNGLMGFYATDPGDHVDYNDWNDSRKGSAGQHQYANPYRAAYANNLFPTNNGVVDPVECGLFREGPDGPLFDYHPETELAFADDRRAAYFRYDMRQRMGNLVTGRSSVFAVWITIGYFEVDQSGQPKVHSSGALQGTGYESGAETGEQIRHRGFFMVDRSIPVAFEPGKNHNVDRAVLIKRIIE